MEKAGELSLTQKKRFCAQHWQINDLTTKKKILWIVLDDDNKNTIIEKTAPDGTPETNVKLDACSEEVVGRIYEIMRARLDKLSRPVGDTTATQ